MPDAWTNINRARPAGLGLASLLWPYVIFGRQSDAAPNLARAASGRISAHTAFAQKVPPAAFRLSGCVLCQTPTLQWGWVVLSVGRSVFIDALIGVPLPSESSIDVKPQQIRRS
jgi:hypothetical protein